MAEYVLIPKASEILDTNEINDEKKALLFFCNKLLSEQKPDASLKERYESIYQRALHIPCFVLERSQSFDHNASHSGENCHSLQNQFMIDEVERFLPSSLKRLDLLQRCVSLAFKTSIPVEPNPGPVPDSASAEKHTPSSEDVTESQSVQTTGDDRCPAYLKCSAIQTNYGYGKCLETCFVYLPSWDEFSLEVHYIKLEVCPVQPQSGLLSRIMNRGHAQEKIDIVGTRSIMKFSILVPTAIETVNLLESKGKCVSQEAIEFIKNANMFTILSANALDDEKISPNTGLESESDPELNNESNTDKPILNNL